MADHALDPAVLDAQLEPLLEAPHWYVGFSGGVDSTVLLHLLQRWRKRHASAPPLSAIHVNHGLQAVAGAWQAHCEGVCRVMQVPLICLPADIKRGSVGPEAAAREARYSLFEQRLAAGEVLFLGHHADDQVETFFLRLMRGAGVRGLAAIPAERPLGAGRLLRPLLQLPRAVLEAYAGAQGLSCVEDPSNSDTALDRNFLRAKVLPLLAERWPGYRQTVARASDHIAVAAGLVEQVVPVPVTSYSAMGDAGVALTGSDSPQPQEIGLALRHWLRAAGLPTPDQAAMVEFQRQLEHASEQARPRLHCSTYTLQRYRDAVYLLPALPDLVPREAMSMSPGETIELPGAGGQLSLAQTPKQGLRLTPDESLQVGWRRGGERCSPHGRPGSASLKKLLQEREVPPWWRDWVPLLYLEGELLAVGDLWLCQSSRWTATPKAGEALWQPRWDRNITAAFD